MTWTNRGWIINGSAWVSKDNGGGGANQPPVADPQSVSVQEDGYIAITLTATDPDGDPLTYAVQTNPVNGVLSGSAPNLIYTPNANYNGSDSFTFQASDGINLSNIATISITVTAVNDPPVANPQSVSVQEDGYIAITLTGSDVDGDPLTFTVLSNPTNGVLTGTAPNLIYTPTANYNGSDSFTFRVNDGTVNSAPATVSITVTAVNDPPVANPQSVTVQEDGYIAITLTGSDIDGDPLTFEVLSNPANGVLTGVAPNLTYTPAANYNGSDSFTFRVNDGTVNSAPATISITVTAVNDPPVADPQSVTVQEDGYIAITLTGSDVDGDPLTFTVLTNPTNGVLTGTAPNLTYTPTANYNGSDSFTFRVNDGTANSAPATVSITVTAVNDPPVANPQSVTTSINTALPITLTGSDVDGNPLTYTVLTNPTNGVLTGTAPNVTYTPNTGYTGGDSFTFRVNDGTVNSNTATITITVSGVASQLSADWTVTQVIPSELTFTRASSGTFYNSSGILQTAATNAARYTYSPSTLASLGLLIEQAATNAALNSNDLTGWGANQVTVAQNTLDTAAPDGSFTAAKIMEVTTAGGEHNIFTNTSFTTWTFDRVYAASIYAKAAGRNHIVIRGAGHSISGTSYLSVRYDLSTGVATPFIGASGIGDILNYGMEALPNGWYRCTMTWRPNSSAGYTNVRDTFRYCVSNGGDPTSFGLPIYAGDNTKGVYMWGAQIEIQTSPAPSQSSSYIPNSSGSAAATRAADSLKVASTAGWYNDPAWTVVHDARYMTETGTATLDKWQQFSPPSDSFFNITYARELGIFTGVSSAATNPAVWSPDGVNWSTATVSGLSNIGFAGQAWSPDLRMLVAVGDTGTGNRAMYSRDGRTWTATPAASNTVSWNDVAWSPSLGLFVAVGYGPGASRAMTSPDGITWTLRGTPGGTSQPAWRGIAWSPSLGLFVAVGHDNGGQGVMTSSDGINWTLQTTPNRQWFGVTWSPDLSLFVAVAFVGTGNNGIMTSPDGVNWTFRNPPSLLDWISVDWSPQLARFVGAAAGSTGTGDQKKMVSSDGINWTARGGTPIVGGLTSDRNQIYRSTIWSPNHGVFAIISLAGNGRVSLSLPTALERRLMRYRSDATTDNWVVGTALTGFLDSGITSATIARFAYYNRRLTASELTSLGVL